MRIGKVGEKIIEVGGGYSGVDISGCCGGCGGGGGGGGGGCSRGFGGCLYSQCCFRPCPRASEWSDGRSGSGRAAVGQHKHRVFPSQWQSLRAATGSLKEGVLPDLRY